ncbi:hypothetical protein HYR53_10635 [Candidatus Acetothermia bacterium]|nr:hypothetical protein [Candidatus Acetothermia bacterium]
MAYYRRERIQNVIIRMEDFKKIAKSIFELSQLKLASSPVQTFRISLLFRDISVECNNPESLPKLIDSNQQNPLRIEVESRDNSIGERIYLHLSTDEYIPDAFGASFVYRNWGRATYHELKKQTRTWEKRNDWIRYFQWILIFSL